MLEDVLALEKELFLKINNWHSPLFDNVLWLYSSYWIWIPFIALFIFALTYCKPLKVWLPVVSALAVMSVLCLLASDVIIKPYFARLRPTYHPGFMNEVKYLFDYKGEGIYGFVSGHATFTFAWAMFTTLLFRFKPFGFTIYAWAIIMVYSRVYLGVHFLTDILAGALVGSLIGLGVFYLYRWVLNKYLYRGIKDKYSLFYSNCRKTFIVSGLICYILLFTVFSEQIVGIYIRNNKFYITPPNNSSYTARLLEP